MIGLALGATSRVPGLGLWTPCTVGSFTQHDFHHAIPACAASTGMKEKSCDLGRNGGVDIAEGEGSRETGPSNGGYNPRRYPTWSLEQEGQRANMLGH